MTRLPCPYVAECGGTVRFQHIDEWDTNAHYDEIVERDCGCELTGDEVEALVDAAAALPLEERADER